MVQNYNFNGKKFCGKKIKSGVKEYEFDRLFKKEKTTLKINKYNKFRDAGLKKTCSESDNNCGSETNPICISKDQECPITSIQFLTKDTFDTASQTQQEADQSLKFVEFDDNHVIAFSNEKGIPITSVKLEQH